MKKLVMTVAVLACAASIASAQTVTSANMVGYAKVTAVGGELSLVALNFETGGLTVSELIGDQLPGGSTIHLWDKSEGKYITANKGRAGWDPDPAINLGDALWFEVSGIETHEVILSGEVLLSETNIVAMAEGITATGYYYPVVTLWEDTDLAELAEGGSVLHFWNGTNYDTYNKGRSGWDGNPSIGVTDGFWLEVEAGEGFSWEEARPFTP